MTATKAVNLLTEKAGVGHGFRNFTDDRLGLLLHCGVRWQGHRTARTVRPLTTLVGVEPPNPQRLPAPSRAANAAHALA
jgi:hypothetical protein